MKSIRTLRLNSNSTEPPSAGVFGRECLGVQFEAHIFRRAGLVIEGKKWIALSKAWFDLATARELGWYLGSACGRLSSAHAWLGASESGAIRATLCFVQKLVIQVFISWKGFGVSLRFVLDAGVSIAGQLAPPSV